MKAYLVLDLTVHDLAGFMPYVAEIPAHIERHGGRYLVRGVAPTVIEGDWAPPMLVVIEFPDRARAEAFLCDPKIQHLFAVRHATTTSRLVVVDAERS